MMSNTKNSETTDEDVLLKYRVEQEISIRMNNTPINNTQVKTDYAVRCQREKPRWYSVSVEDYLTKMSPDSHQALLDTVKEIDRIKSNVEILINTETGKPEQILNHQNIIERWLAYKNEFLKKNEFVGSEEARKNISDFMAAFDNQIRSHE